MFKNTNECQKSVCAEDVQQSTHPALTFPREIYVATQTGSGIAKKKKREREGETLSSLFLLQFIDLDQKTHICIMKVSTLRKMVLKW